jgi:hypothetical protein
MMILINKRLLPPEVLLFLHHSYCPTPVYLLFHKTSASAYITHNKTAPDSLTAISTTHNRGYFMNLICIPYKN